MKNINIFKIKIRILYLLSLSIIISLICASDISMLYINRTALDKVITSSILLTICGAIISIPIYIGNNALKNIKLDELKTYNIILNIVETALFMVLIYILFTIYKFLILM